MTTTTGIGCSGRPALDDLPGNGTRPRLSKLTLAAVPTASGCARLFVRDVLTQWGLVHLIATAELLASELVTNAIATTGTMDASARGALASGVHLIEIRVVLGGRLFIGVWDHDEKPPVLQEPDLDAESGRGLLLINCMSSRWGYHPTPGFGGGKMVWFELDCSPPTTRSGLPIRTPGVGTAQRMNWLDDLELLRRVIDRLRQLQ